MTYEEALRSTFQTTWTNLSAGSRLEVLQAIEDNAAREAQRASREVEGRWLHVEGDGTILGQYASSDKKIQVNLEQLGDGPLHGSTADEMIETVLHEGRHSYQWQVVSGEVSHPDIGQAKEWAANLAPGGYVNFEENPRAYWSQPVEVDARSYAAERLGRLQRERASLDQAKNARETFERQSGWGTRSSQGNASEFLAGQRAASVRSQAHSDGMGRGHGMKR